MITLRRIITNDLKTSNVNIGLTKEELELAKANPEVFIEYLKYKREY